ncbi:SDR family NAD(P)-dependent oxidoreductase, partial [Vibrio parahaemolyticus]
MTLLDRFSLAGKSAFVTGGASGLGLAYVEAVAEGGGAVTIADLDAAAAQREASRLTALGHTVRHARVDVSNDEDLRRAFDEHEDKFGALDIVFANAGLAMGDGYIGFDGQRSADGQIDTYPVDHWRTTLA